MDDRGVRIAYLRLDLRKPLELERTDDRIARHRHLRRSRPRILQRLVPVAQSGICQTQVTERVDRGPRIHQAVLQCRPRAQERAARAGVVALQRQRLPAQQVQRRHAVFPARHQPLRRAREGGERRIGIARHHRQPETQQRHRSLRIGIGGDGSGHAACGSDVPGEHAGRRALLLRLDVAGEDRKRTRERGIRVGVAAHGRERVGDLARDQRIARVEHLGIAQFADPTLGRALAAVHVGDGRDDFGVVGHARARDLELRQCRRIVAMSPVMHVSQRQVRFRQRGLQRKRLARRTVGECHDLGPAVDVVPVQVALQVRQLRIGKRERRIGGDRLAVQLGGLRSDGGRVVRAAGLQLPEQRQRLQVEIMRLDIARGHAGDPRGLRGQQLRLQRVGDAGRDVALHREHVLQVAVVVLGPEVAVGTRVDQLQVDAHLAGGLLHAAFEHRRDAELLGHDLQVRWVAGVLLGRRARDDFQVVDSGEPCEDLVLHAGGEIGICLVIAEVLEGQHGDRFQRGRGCHRRIG